MVRSLALVRLIFVAIYHASGEEAVRLSCEMRDDKQIVIKADDVEIASYIYADEKIPRPYFAHLKSLGGSAAFPTNVIGTSTTWPMGSKSSSGLKGSVR